MERTIHPQRCFTTCQKAEVNSKWVVQDPHGPDNASCEAVAKLPLCEPMATHEDIDMYLFMLCVLLALRLSKLVGPRISWVHRGALAPASASRERSQVQIPTTCCMHGIACSQPRPTRIRVQPQH